MKKKNIQFLLLVGTTLLSATIFPTMYQIKPALIPNNRVVTDQAKYQKELDRLTQLREEFKTRRNKFMPKVKEALAILNRDIPEHDTQAITLLKELTKNYKDSLLPKEKDIILWAIEVLRNPNLKNRDEAKRLLIIL